MKTIYKKMNFIRKNYTLPDWFEINDIDWVL
jgi:hypothetical protein